MGLGKITVKKTVISLVFSLLLLPAGAYAAPLNLFFSPLPLTDSSSYLQQVGTLASADPKAGSVTVFSQATPRRTALSGAPSMLNNLPNFSSLRPSDAPMATHVMPTGGVAANRSGGENRIIIVSEPSLLLLLGLGLVAIVAAGRR